MRSIRLAEGARMARKRREAAVRHSWALRGPIAQQRPSWRRLAACSGLDPSTMFPTTAAGTAAARAVCAACPVRMDCLAEAESYEAGRPLAHLVAIRGGLSPLERHRGHLDPTTTTAR